MLFQSILGSACLALCASAAAPSPKELFGKDDFYKNHEGKEQDFVGVLKFTPPEKGAVGFARTNPYRLEFLKDKEIREVYVGKKIDLLTEFVGMKVRITGKPVELEVEGKTHKEIWPARIEVLREEK